MPASLMSEKAQSSSKTYGVDVVPGICRDEHAHIRPINPRVLTRATLKIDFYLIPIVAMFQLLFVLDKSNIGNARVAGLTTSLHMSTKQFSIALAITYVWAIIKSIPFILMGLPMTLLMKRIGANVMLPIMAILWGVVCACQGAVHSYHGLLVCRFFLGSLEAGLFPGITLLFSNFYKRHAMQFRFAMMHSTSSLAGAFSGLLAYGVQNLNGKQGISGWQWIFIVEGTFTVTFGLATLFFVPTSPRSVKLLTEEERETYCYALAEDWSGDADTDGTYQEVFSWSEVASAFTRAPHILMLFVLLLFHGTMFYGLANFTPTIVNALGNSPNDTQLLTVPPYICSFVFSLVSAYFCDKYKNRSMMAVVCALISAAGYAIFLSSDNKSTNYGSLYLQIIGSYAVTPCLATWNTDNMQPHYRRATAIGIGSVAINAGGMISSWLFTDPPRFQKATRTNLAFSLGMAAFSVAILVYCRARNIEKQREVQRLLQMHGDGTGVGGWDSSAERKRLGDRHPRFAFTM